MVGLRVRERALDVPEQLALEKCLGDCPCIHADHRPGGTPRKRVNLMCEHILSCSVLSGNQHGGVRSRDFLHVAAQPPHSRALAPEHPRPVVGRLDLRHGLFPVTYFRKRLNQLRVVPWLHDKILRPAFHSFHREGDVRIGREQHHCLLRPP